VTGVLLLGGEAATAAQAAPAIEAANFVVAADSGYDLALELGVAPDLVVGDFDSVAAFDSLAQLPAAAVRRWPVDKDHTDAELGLAALREFGCTTARIVGGGGIRFDHQLAVLQLFRRDTLLTEWLTAHEHMLVISDRELFAGWRGATVSIFALSGSVAGVASVGLRWPLNGIELSPTRASISNQVVADTFELSVASGRLLLVRPWPRPVSHG
jgi:thiamine pyrophosphokinase